MNLKAFHLFFIAVSVVLAAFVAAWSVNQYQVAHRTSYALATAASVACGIALIVYATAFQRKMRRL
jgi:ABC-type Mn2+/Zn2+ transport system permease subunit